ncbi:MAG: bifunctional 4-hydroxy-2-oxoglutarate aldolase/2-dehydro-3-deoxy-phosphogluconate aldolase [Lentisphaeria bacterium]|nr:bifunctional 4-hydroxy-2-oxoglutarate aldolase/2-dehydro-3-deoxy-phosphogluconate aldolase [Lentisphaeria bacterium]
MNDEHWVWERIKRERIIAVARGDGAKNLVSLAKALGDVGVRVFELTMTTPGALNSTRELCDALPDLLIGVGSVINARMAERAIAAGAQFLVSPIFDLGVMRVARELDTPVIPGTFTPTEAQKAWEAGADAVKVFPASVLGPGYLSSILAPLPHLQLVPTGGIDLDNATMFLDAGAAALAIGGSLIDRQSLQTGEFDAVLERAAMLVKRIEPYRE